MDLKEKLLSLGFEETYYHGQYIKRDLSIFVYVRYNKIAYIQISKVWVIRDFNNYTEYLNKVNYVLDQIGFILYKGE